MPFCRRLIREMFCLAQDGKPKIYTKGYWELPRLVLDATNPPRGLPSVFNIVTGHTHILIQTTSVDFFKHNTYAFLVSSFSYAANILAWKSLAILQWANITQLFWKWSVNKTDGLCEIFLVKCMPSCDDEISKQWWIKMIETGQGM